MRQNPSTPQAYRTCWKRESASCMVPRLLRATEDTVGTWD